MDIRLARRNNEYYIVHGLYSYSLQTVLDEIHDFLDTHPGELVVVDFAKIFDYDAKVFYHWLVAHNYYRHVHQINYFQPATYGYLTYGGTRAALLYLFSNTETSRYFYDTICVQSEYADTDQPSQLVRQFETLESAQPSCLTVLQAVLTLQSSSPDSLLRSVWDASLVRRAKQLHLQLLPHLHDWMSKRRVLLLDYVDNPETLDSFMNLVVAKNKQI